MINLLKMLSLSPETQQQNRSYKICEEQVQKLHRWNRKIKSHRGRAGGESKGFSPKEILSAVALIRIPVSIAGLE